MQKLIYPLSDISRDIFINLLSDLIFYASLLIIFTGLYLIFNRKKLLQFFGISQVKKLVIYTSNLYVKRYGSLGINKKSYSFSGTAIPYEESSAANSMKGLFNVFLPSQVDKPGLLNKVLLSDVNVLIYPSPIDNGIFEQDASIISLGFPIYNNISKIVEEIFNPPGKLDYAERSDKNQKNLDRTAKNYTNTASFYGSLTNSAYTKIITSPSAINNSQNDSNQEHIPAISIFGSRKYFDTSIGFIQKILDENNNRNIFYIAGLSEHSTAGCLYYLKDNWKKIHNNFEGNSQFLLVLKISIANNKMGQILEQHIFD